MVKKLFSIKMRASKWDSIKGENEHISGAEKIISEECIDTTVHNLINRALGHSKGQSDFINISINKVDTEKITYIPCLDISTIYSNTPYDGRQHILELLKQINIDTKKGKFILSILESADNMRGAIILDLLTMKRLEKDKKEELE
ncbi:6-carboxyhexanoate--CoA ligase BioW [Gottschalkia acidurici 9a]|uniref:6-carboxyhexanoate--CoA ligase n=1 Tax=Gottschalkia acidurici (strain ATCC 7906 / DSM 604 / BCRC 14475 / CIP 104303 / KCTC 5404 / NCIMB 10678 / 9a) TaxID=1128398 RepID=K0B241_GOTA9|nr:6-carboxyhexanoate--CoA ligase [Gottschalkia acidurici]AFS79549.1 6-carboxyhexanoate--CoA ligase BioW [Gottschalkia acidurici 9a]